MVAMLLRADSFQGMQKGPSAPPGRSGQKSSSDSWLAIRIPASEPVAAVGHPPAKDADGNRGQQRPNDGQGDICYQSQRNEGSPEDLALHSFILARAGALRPPVKVRVSRKNTCPDKMMKEKSKLLTLKKTAGGALRSPTNSFLGCAIRKLDDGGT